MRNYDNTKEIDFQDLRKGAPKYYLLAFPRACSRVLTHDVELISDFYRSSAKFRFGKSHYIAVSFTPDCFASLCTRLRRIQYLLKENYDYYVISASSLHRYLRDIDMSPESYFSVHYGLLRYYNTLMDTFGNDKDKSRLFSCDASFDGVTEVIAEKKDASAAQLSINFLP